MDSYYVFGTLRNFLPKVCEALRQECSKYTKDALEHCCRKPKQTAKIFRAEDIITVHPSRVFGFPLSRE
jgi:hypothetical protein